MNKRVLIVACCITLMSCSIKTFVLENKITKVPIDDSKVYINKNKFNFTLLSKIDTNVVYEKLVTEYNIVARLDNHNETNIYGIYKFYPNGNLNYFVVDRDEPFVPNILNPNYSGYRGVYYSDGNKIKGDLYAPADERQHIGKLDRIFSIKGDSLLVERKYGYIDIYIKRKLPPEYFVYKANW
jgi:hypothetical protein